MRAQARTRATERGFTMIEAIVVIVIIGILGAIVATFIRAPIQSYVDSVARAETTDDADLALRRMARDIRLALPNSVRVSADGSAIEFLMTSTGGRYLADDDGVADGVPLDFQNSANLAFDVVGNLTQPVNPGDFVVVYNLGTGAAPADAYQFNVAGAQRNIARVRSVATAARGTPPLPVTTITLADNPFARQAEPMPSPGRRFQVVTGPVSYRCESDGTNRVLRRYDGYAITANMPATAPADGRRALMAARVVSCANVFRYDNALADEDNVQLRTSALVVLNMSLRTRNVADPAVRLVHQVHVDNMP